MNKYNHTSRLLHTSSGKISNNSQWEWSDLDGARLVWVTKGLLYAVSRDDKGLTEAKTLQNFNEMAFKAIEAPY